MRVLVPILAMFLGAAPCCLADEKTVAELLEKLREGKKTARLEAVNKLGILGPAAAKAAPALGQTLYIPDDSEVTVAAAIALAKIGTAGLPELVVALRDSRPYVRQLAMSSLARMGPMVRPAEEYLVAGLSDPHAPVRAYAALALAEMVPDKEATILALCRTLRDPVAQVRAQALTALHRAGARAVPGLKIALRDPQDFARVDAAQTLALIGPEAADAMEPLLTQLKDPDPAARAAGAKALGAIGIKASKALPDLLQSMIQDKNIAVQEEAFNAVGRVGAGDVQKLAEELRKANEQGAWAAPFFLAQFGPRGRDAVRPLIKLMGDPDHGMRLGAILALGQLGPDAAEAVPFLAQQLRNPDIRLRTAAAASLQRLDPRQGQAAAFQLRQYLAQGRNLVDRFDPDRKGGNFPFGPLKQNGLDQAMARLQYDHLLEIHLFLSTIRLPPNTPPLEKLQISNLQRNIMDTILSLPPDATPALVQTMNKAMYYKLGFS